MAWVPCRKGTWRQAHHYGAPAAAISARFAATWVPGEPAPRETHAYHHPSHSSAASTADAQPPPGQHGAQMALPEDQYAVQELPAQGADEALANRVHPRSPDGGAQDSGTDGLEDGVERAGE